MATKKQRYMISVNDDMFNEIENFRFENRFSTRSEATTELIRLGLEQLKKKRSDNIPSGGGLISFCIAFFLLDASCIQYLHML